ncbi:ATP-binding cassette sub- G member 2 [Phlyctochytrium planicorne]|nr:ATP-binding cassette sub- G member 2 [Phlyctochytrium planicorne]
MSQKVYDIERGSGSTSYEAQRQWQHELKWNNITYEIKSGKKTTRQLLKNLSGSIRSGEMVAIMGSSGAGKTTLLNCLSGRLSTGNLSGSITYDGKPRNPGTWKRTMSFVEQDDALYSQITVKETLRYAARLRLPSNAYTLEEKYKRADDILKSLRLSKAADTPIGDGSIRGVSGGERKRTAIGQELVGNPEILFLDEPTSGLDSNSAISVMENVKNDAQTTGRIVISTIHQPSAELLEVFDRVLLLSGGSTVFFGPPAEAVEYFTRLGFPLRSHSQNPADHFMDLLTIDSSKPEDEVKKDVDRIAALQVAYASYKSTPPLSDKGTTLDQVELVDDILDRNERTELTRAKKEGGIDAINNVKGMYWANNWFTEFGILFSRAWLQLTRSTTVLVALTIRTIILVLLMGFTFYRLKADQKSIQNRMGFLFFWPVNQVFNTMLPILAVFPLERVIMLRERAGRSYRVSSFFFARVVTEMIPATIFTLMACIPLYFMIGLRTDTPLPFIRFLILQWVEVLGSLAVGFIIGAAVPILQLAQVIGPLVGVIFLLYGGCLLNNEDLPNFFKIFQYTSPVNYAFRGNMMNEFQGLSLSCSADPTQPCFKNGDQVLSLYSVDTYSVWANIGFNAALFAGYITIGYLVLRIAGKPKIKLV